MFLESLARLNYMLKVSAALQDALISDCFVYGVDIIRLIFAEIYIHRFKRFSCI